MKKLLCLITAIILATMSFSGCGCEPAASVPSEPSVPPVTVNGESAESFLRNNFPKIDGSTSTKPLEAAVRSAVFGISASDAMMSVKHTTTFDSFNNLIDGKCDVTFSVPLSPEQKALAAQRGLTVVETPIAREAFVFVINSQNPVSELSQQQIKDIYSGKITNWKEVGGDDAPIVAYQRNKDSGSQTYMTQFMGDAALMSPNTTFTPDTMEGLMDAIAVFDNSKYSIGYSVYAYAADMYGTGTELKFVKVDGIAPESATMTDGSYPLLSHNYALFLDTQPENSPARVVTAWLVSDAGQVAVKAGGYIPLRGVVETPTTHENLYKAKGTGAAKPVGFSAPTHYYRVGMDQYGYTQEGVTQTLVANWEGDKLIYAVQGLTDKTLQDKINAFISGSSDELLTRTAEFEAWLAQRNIDYKAAQKNDPDTDYNDNYDLFHMCLAKKSDDEWVPYPVMVTAQCMNGYISIAVSLCYEGYTQSCWDVRTAVFDMYTGKKLSLSDMFWKGEDFVPGLTAQITENALMPQFYEYIPLAHENPALTNAEADDFTLSGVYYTNGNHCFVDCSVITVDFLTENSVISVARDMEGMWENGVETEHSFVIEDCAAGNSRACDIEWLALINRSAYLTPEVIEKINTRVYNARKELAAHPISYYLEMRGLTVDEFLRSQINYFVGDLESFIEQIKVSRGTTDAEIAASYGETDSVEYWVVGGKYVAFNSYGPSVNVWPDTMYAQKILIAEPMIFDAKTGEPYDINNLLSDGWQTASKWYTELSVRHYNADWDEFEELPRTAVAAPDLSSLVLCEISTYEYEGMINLTFISKDNQTVYYVEVPAQYMPIN